MNLTPRDDGPFRGLETWRSRSRTAGFSFPELLLAAALAAFVLIAAVLAFRAIGQYTSRRTNIETITFADTSVMNNFFGSATDSISTWSAPTYGHLAKVEQMRDMYVEDMQQATAVYCMPRTARGTLRTTSVTIPGAYAFGTYDYRRMSTPEAFRLFLVAAGIGTEFTTNAYNAEGGSAKACNLSIVMLGQPASRTAIYVRCVYEIDFIRPASPGGVYASVRRYVGPDCTHYYDVFYPDTDAVIADSTYFYVAAFFERVGRPAGAANAGSLGEKQPFFLVWWPDPATTLLPGAVGVGDYEGAMQNQTSLMTVTPMFPSL